MLLNCDLLDDYIDSSPQYSMKRGLYHAISLIERSRSIEERKIGKNDGFSYLISNYFKYL